MPTFKTNQCPVCQSSSFSIIGKSDLGTVNVEKPQNPLVVKCKNCKTIYANPLPIWDASDFSELYKTDYFTPVPEKWTKTRSEINPAWRFKKIEKYLKTDNRNLLEFGAGIQAYMAKYLHAKNWNIDIQEPSKDFGNALEKIYPQFKIIKTGFLNIHSTTRYSLIYSDSVLEHVHNPIDYIQKCAELLEPGGILYFISPNEHSFRNWGYTFLKKIKGKPVNYLAPYTNPYHLIGFSHKGIQIMAKKSGLQFVKHIRSHDYECTKLIEKRKNIIYYPFAFLLYIADLMGWGTNQEIILRKE
jgi:2-polyprenyl-3-methyl-5-hydroxy-6-metoxy-1,4-benzoquinol methylase